MKFLKPLFYTISILIMLCVFSLFMPTDHKNHIVYALFCLTLMSFSLNSLQNSIKEGNTQQVLGQYLGLYNLIKKTIKLVTFIALSFWLFENVFNFLFKTNSNISSLENISRYLNEALLFSQISFIVLLLLIWHNSSYSDEPVIRC